MLADVRRLGGRELARVSKAHNAVAVRIDADKDPRLVKALNIQSYPTLVFAASDGKILGIHEGFVDAAKFRQQAGTSAPHTELACDILCGLSGEKVAYITDVARENLPDNAAEPAYEIWRQRLAAQFAAPVESEFQQKETIR